MVAEVAVEVAVEVAGTRGDAEEAEEEEDVECGDW